MLRNKYLLLLLVFLFGGALYAQTAALALKIDSLQTALQQADSSKSIDLQLELAKSYTLFDTRQAHIQLQQLLSEQYKNKLNDSQRLKALLLRADLYLLQDRQDEALPLLKEATSLALLSQKLPGKAFMKPFAEKNEPSEKQNTFTVYKMVLLFLGISFLLLIILLVRQSIVQKRSLEKVSEAYAKSLQDFNAKEAEIEEEISQRTKHLNEQIEKSRQKDLELKKALKRAEDANYLKNAFLSNMSHEIRMPLNGIIGFSSLLETELSIMENKELYDYASGIQQSGDRLLNLLNNIIDISRIEANEIEVELHACAVNEILQHVIDLTVFSANEKALTFKSKLGELPPVIADNAKLMRVFHIIVDNAIKYTNEGFVTITSSYEAENNQVVVIIKDTGLGMEEEFQMHLFEAFRQESSGYGRSYQGAGLGLPLAKRLLDLMHARIQISSKGGLGTTVSLFLPCEITKGSAEAKQKQQATLPIPNAPEIGALDIFIVEDDRMNRMVLEKILRKAGHLTMAVDGEETLKIISERHKRGHVFQVMLFDINLPSPWDGIMLMKKIRESYQEYRYIPFIAQTAYAMAGDKEKMLDAGFDDYIAKPINKNELLTIIKNQLDKFIPLQSKTE
ncbi:MAG: response regulator [Bacteroidetes bacterium]|nr:response regulator [Bacteroidota bacterium]MBU2466298.1 response regulator [Bacteroidota bacterium]